MIADSLGVRERDRDPAGRARCSTPTPGASPTPRWPAGADLVMPGPDLSPPAIADLIEDERVTVAAGVPTIWMGVLPELEGPRHVAPAGHPVRRLGGAQGAVGGATASRPACRSCRRGA